MDVNQIVPTQILNTDNVFWIAFGDHQREFVVRIDFIISHLAISRQGLEMAKINRRVAGGILRCVLAVDLPLLKELPVYDLPVRYCFNIDRFGIGVLLLKVLDKIFDDHEVISGKIHNKICGITVTALSIADTA